LDYHFGLGVRLEITFLFAASMKKVISGAGCHL